MSCVTLLGEHYWKLAPGFLQALLCIPFPLADSALYLFTEISHSHDNDYTLGPVTLLENHQTPTHSFTKKN